MIDIRFQPNNTHLLSSAPFARTDPHLRRLYMEKYVFRSALIDAFPRNEPAILTLGGGRQIGKTTLLKQWIEDLLLHGVTPQAICFLSGELINDHQSLYTILQEQLTQMPADQMKYIILDEVTYIQDWDKTIKYLADIGALEKTVLVLSGSDLALMQDARKRFPGRRGKASVVDFHYYPLSFHEFLSLKKQLPDKSNITPAVMSMLYAEFEQYLLHGGFLSAINDYAAHQSIQPATLRTYSDWIRGDVLKRNKKELFLREIIGAVLKHYTKQVSWDNLVKELSIDHTQTIVDYMSLLSAMDAVFVQAAIIEDKLVPAPKKRKKLLFCDPFIYHSMRAWLFDTADPFSQQMQPLLSDSQLCSDLVEACVIAHFRRYYPTYYIKADGEVDIAYVHNQRFWPVEIKWTTQIRPGDLKQIMKYPNSEIYAKVNNFSALQQVPIKPLPLALLDLPTGMGRVD